MAASIFSLFGEIFIDNDKANESIDTTTAKGSTMSEKLSTGFGAVAKGAAVVGTAAVAAGTALWGMAQNAAGTTDAIDKQRQALGFSVEGYQEWKYVLGQNGADIEKMGTAMKTLSTVMDGTSKAGVEALGKLGISIEGMNNEEAFSATVAALQGIEDETLKAQIAQDLYGKSYQSLMPLLNQTVEGTEELTKRAHDLGLVLSEDAVNAGVVFGDTLDDLKQGFSAIITQLGASMMPILTQGMEYIIELLPIFQEIAQQLIPILLSLLETLLPIFMQLVEQLLPPLLEIISAVLPLLTTIIDSILPPILSIITQIMPFLAEIVQNLVPVLVQLLQAVLPILTPLIQSILPPLLDLLQLLIEPLMELLNMVLPPLIEIITFLSDVLVSTLGGAFTALQPPIDNVMNIFKSLIDFIKNVFTGNWSAAWENVKSIFSNIFQGIANAVKAPINFIINGINSFINGLNKIKIPDWVPVVGGKGFNIGTIPLLAKGGRITNDGLAIVGEEGPELLNLNKGAEVVPLNRITEQKTDLKVVVQIEHFHNESKQDVNEFAEELSEIMEAKLRRKEAVFS